MINLNDVRLEEGNIYTSYVATNLGTTNAKNFYQYLNLKPADYEPPELKYIEEKQTYADSVLEVLNRWQQINGKQATLGWLIEALQKASLNGIAQELFDKCFS